VEYHRRTLHPTRRTATPVITHLRTRLLNEFIESLRKLKDPENNDHLEYELYQITGPIEDLENIDEAIAPIFEFFETYPDADFGSPGPLVHLLEKHPGRYETKLEASMRRKPTPHPIWMVNRLLNSNLSDAERQRWMTLMRSVLDHPHATESARSNAEMFLEHQFKSL
jgi:hypothetical protein